MIFSIIIPVLNEADEIVTCLSALQPFRARGHEVIVVDGGSADATVALALPLADQVISAPSGRAIQMNAGAAVARGDVLLFLHVDTCLPRNTDAILQDIAFGDHTWGRYDVRLAGASKLYRIIETCMNLRSRWTGIATGDQAIFMSKQCFSHAGGFPAIVLMEDVAFSRILKRLARPVCLHDRVITSSRRWEKYGTVRTILRMWSLRLRYFAGVDPASLARDYD